jgi:hypothetical protein
MGIFITTSQLANILFGIFVGAVLLLFLYYIRLQGKVRGSILAEFWSSTGDRDYVLCKKKREMLIDQSGVEITKGSDELTEDEKNTSQLVVEIEVPKKHIKWHPEMAQVGYFTRRDCVDRCLYPIHSPLPIRVPASICSWEIGSSEPIDPRELHKKLPITSSAGFSAGIREHDILMQAGMMVESMQNFMEESAKKMASVAKGALSKNFMMTVAIILGLLIMVAIGASVFVVMKLQGLGI